MSIPYIITTKSVCQFVINNKELQKIYIGYDNKNKEEKEEIKLQVADLKQE